MARRSYLPSHQNGKGATSGYGRGFDSTRRTREFENVLSVTSWQDRTLITASSFLLSSLATFLFTPSTWYLLRSRSSPARPSSLEYSRFGVLSLRDNTGADQGLVPDLPQLASDDDRSRAGRRTSGTRQGDQGVEARAFGLKRGQSSSLAGLPGGCRST
jgi:hypothetical protein